MSDTDKLNASQIGSLRGFIPVVPDEDSILREQPSSPVGDLLTLDLTQKKNYVVIVQEGMTIDTLEYDLERDTSRDNTVNSNIVPDRVVEVANRRPGSDRQTHYFLTDEEAKNLTNHPMVKHVILDPEENPLGYNQLHSKINQNFERVVIFTGSAAGDVANFGLYR